ncbi:flagellar basal body P-ring formation chaperone FlgA [Inhella gelatinilytica]|uniref:Flagella basal body P-ring formation protein FlgA n=1 Tax=Inhella gelatinilytica TaxID=2795030 RepID=A0A931J108_9BURK|nr:flagellar basal body P-ring formation chaperone FlgA [Inhella gelatinilytica]MBH9553538.1 flagellar basal body P-ring formation protein FlgA [Inhella gelatinilytica]
MKAVVVLAMGWVVGSHAQASLLPQWRADLQRLTEDAVRAAVPAPAQSSVEVGEPDSRLRLAPCAQVQAFVPPGQSLWGRSRVGLRCLQGAVRWSITVPVHVRVLAEAWAATQPLPAGATLGLEHVVRRRVELTAEVSPALAQAEPPVGRVLARPIEAGDAVRQHHLRQRQWFAAGAPVQLRLAGAGFSIRTEGQALTPGWEGQTVRVKLESGRTVLGQAVGPHEVELPW